MAGTGLQHVGNRVAMKALTGIGADPGEVRKTATHEYVIRFLFGGIITVVIGVVAKAFGPVVAGLFLAFPAILPASLTLMAEHDGRSAAATEAEGAALGSIGLLAFGMVVWRTSGDVSGWMVLIGATLAWLAVSTVSWFVLQWHRARRSAG